VKWGPVSPEGIWDVRDLEAQEAAGGFSCIRVSSVESITGHGPAVLEIPCIFWDSTTKENSIPPLTTPPNKIKIRDKKKIT
jgi:hypothetical protein